MDDVRQAQRALHLPQRLYDYCYADAGPNPSHRYLWPVIQRVIASTDFAQKRAIDIGCGNGATAQMLYEHGFDVIGVDLSESGLAQARSSYPGVSFFRGSAYDDLSTIYGQFSLAVGLEVIEHLYYPGEFCKTLYGLLSKGGVGIVSTPYHGYWKNLAIALTGRWDRHHNPTRDGGHIKFFSLSSFRALLEQAGFSDVRLLRVGRVPPLAKSMVAIVRK
jgi:2-polyprenyl-6-hydroxyphenyl methylase/3-demethylubiquinone-9 3-methyltransferase